MRERGGVGRLEIARADLERPVEAEARLIGAVLLLQQLSHAVPKLGPIGLEHERAVETFDRLIAAAEIDQRGRQIRKIVRHVGVAADRLREPGDGEIVLSRDDAKQSHQVQGVGMTGIDRQRLPAALLGLRDLAGLEQAQPGLEIGGGCLRARSRRGLDARSGGGARLSLVHRRMGKWPCAHP